LTEKNVNYIFSLFKGYPATYSDKANKTETRSKYAIDPISPQSSPRKNNYGELTKPDG
jgi:hypothetical protein